MKLIPKGADMPAYTDVDTFRAQCSVSTIAANHVMSALMSDIVRYLRSSLCDLSNIAVITLQQVTQVLVKADRNVKKFGGGHILRRIYG